MSDCDDFGAVDWRWQAASCCLSKTRFGGTRSIPVQSTAPSRARTKRDLRAPVGPLGIEVAAANVNDMTLLKATIEEIVAEKPEARCGVRSTFCLTRDLDNRRGRGVASAAG